MGEYFEKREDAENYIRRASRSTVLFARIQLHGSEKWMVDHDRRDLGGSIKILENLTDKVSQILSAGESSQFKACPSCGKTTPKLNIFRCSCGKVYCDDCSGGGLINLPRCPVSAYHEGMKKVGAIQA